MIQITLSKDQIARNGVIPTQIISALQGAGQTVNAGKYPDDQERIAVYVDGAVHDEADILNLEIQTLDGKTLRIGDIARVERTFSTPQRNGFFVSGKPALAICIRPGIVCHRARCRPSGRCTTGRSDAIPPGRILHRQDLLSTRQGE